MKSWLSRTPGGPETLVLQETDPPRPSTGELLVRVLAVGINYPDALLIRDQYQVKVPRPFVPGAEFTGEVEAVGADVRNFSPGDRVIARCGWGGLKERAVVGCGSCVRLPAELSPVDAAGFLFIYATAYHALCDVAAIRAGESMLVLGAAGGVGSAAVDLGRALGARVFAAASSKEKVDYALSRGATSGLVYPPDMSNPGAQRELAQALKGLIGSEGADVVFDPVGGAYSEPALRALGPGGRHLVVGFTAGIPRMPLNLVLLKRCKVLGVDWRAFLTDDPVANDGNVQSLLALWREERIHPDKPQTFPFSQAPDAIERVERRQAVGKIVVIVD